MICSLNWRKIQILREVGAFKLNAIEFVAVNT